MCSDITVGSRPSTVDTTGRVEQSGQPGNTAAGPAVQYDAGDPTGAGSTLDAEGALARPGVMSADSMVLMLTAISNKMASERSKNLQSSIKSRSKEKQMKHEETVDKMQKAIKAQNKSKTGALVGKIFGWIAVALMFVVAAAVAVASGGAAAAPLFVAATITLGVMIMQESGGTEKLMDATNMSQKDRMIFSISMAVAMLVINITAAAMSFGAGSAGAASAVAEVAEAGAEIGAEAGAAAAEGAAEAGAEGAAVAAETAGEVGSETAATVAETAAETASETAATASESATETAAETASEIAETAGQTIEETGSTAGKTASEGAKSSARAVVAAQKIKGAAGVMAGVSGVGGGSATAVSTAAGKEAADAQAATKDLRADMLQLDAMNEEDMAHLRKVLEQLQDQVAEASLMLAESFSTSKKILSSSSV